MKIKTKINLSLINIISIFIVIIIIGYVLIPWSKSNTENFANVVFAPPKDGSPTITLFDYILESRVFSIDFENRIKELKKVLESGGVLKAEDYKEIIDEVKNNINNNTDYKSNQKIGKYILNQNDKDETIADLNKQINDLTNKLELENASSMRSPNLQSTEIKNKTIKSVKYGLSLSIQELRNGKIMIHLNNGCLTYDKENPTKEYYSIKHCEITNSKQHFVIRENINNFVISPVNNLNLLLKVDQTGLSLEPSQIIIESQGYPEEFGWIVLPFQTNTCNKLEKKKVTIK
jgi:hypothetical protein